MKYRCVKCGFGTKTLLVQYSPGNIRLMKCENCKAIADEYIECEFMIILIDLILHKPKAYRHILYNVLNQETVNLQGLLWKFTVGFLLLDAYRSLLLQRNEEERDFSLSFSSSQKIFMDIFAGNLMFLCILVLAARILLNKPVAFSRFRNLLLAILVSSYFKIFLVSMMVWEFPSSVIFIIDLFVLSSNTVALKGYEPKACLNHGMKKKPYPFPHIGRFEPIPCQVHEATAATQKKQLEFRENMTEENPSSFMGQQEQDAELNEGPYGVAAAVGVEVRRLID